MDLQPDSARADPYYGYVEDYLESTRVPFREGNFYHERNLRKADGTTNKGRLGPAARTIRDAEYQLILQADFSDLAKAECRMMERDPDEAAGSLIEFSGRRIRSPRTASRAPASLFVAWHSREAFRSPPR